MVKEVVIGVIVVASLGLAGWVYWTIISKNLATAAIAVDKQAVVASSSNIFTKANAYLLHWKTILLAWVAVLAQAFSFIGADTLTAWSGLPWSQVIDAKVASWITIICAILIPITHSAGIKTAAITTPAAPNPDETN